MVRGKGFIPMGSATRGASFGPNLAPEYADNRALSRLEDCVLASPYDLHFGAHNQNRIGALNQNEMENPQPAWTP
jgi:hypothetical protein